MHYIPVRKPGNAFHDEESSQQNQYEVDPDHSFYLVNRQNQNSL